MKHSIYLNSKELIKSEAKTLKAQNTDKPYIREVLNNLCDDLCKQINHYAMKETISDKQAQMYNNWLSSFTASMHP